MYKFTWLLAGLLLQAAVAVPALAGGAWFTYEDICAMHKKEGRDCNVNDPPVVTDKGFFVTWGGEVSEIYYTQDGQATRFRIRISWTSDKSPYRCGQIIEKKFSDVKQMNFRSVAMRRCR